MMIKWGKKDMENGRQMGNGQQIGHNRGLEANWARVEMHGDHVRMGNEERVSWVCVNKVEGYE